MLRIFEDFDGKLINFRLNSGVAFFTSKNNLGRIFSTWIFLQEKSRFTRVKNPDWGRKNTGRNFATEIYF